MCIQLRNQSLSKSIAENNKQELIMNQAGYIKKKELVKSIN